MQENLWGEQEIIPLQHTQRKTNGSTPTAYIPATPNSCEFYGHTWEYFGITGLKQCTVCQIKGYCPGCTKTPPLATAQPFYCTRHTLTGSEGSA